MTDSTSVDYTAVLADLKSKRDMLDAAIVGIETMLGIRGLSGESAQTAATTSPQQLNDLGRGAFLGMTIVDEAKKYLAHKRESQSTEKIMHALRDGGIVLTGATPLNVVGSVLNRNFNSGGDIVKVSRGVWGLADWHPRLRVKRQPNAEDMLAELDKELHPPEAPIDPPEEEDLAS